MSTVLGRSEGELANLGASDTSGYLAQRCIRIALLTVASCRRVSGCASRVLVNGSVARTAERLSREIPDLRQTPPRGRHHPG